LKAIRAQLEIADTGLVRQTNPSCCFVKSDKYWITDSQGIALKTYNTLASTPTFGDDTRLPNSESSC